MLANAKIAKLGVAGDMCQIISGLKYDFRFRDTVDKESGQKEIYRQSQIVYYI